MSEILEQLGPIDLPNVKCTKRYISDGAMHLPGHDHPSCSLNENPATMNSVVDTVATISKKKKKKKRKKGKSTKSSTEVGSFQLSRAGMNNPSSKYDEDLKNDPPSAGVNLQLAPCMSEFCENQNAHNGKKLPQCSNIRNSKLTGNYLPDATQNHSDCESSNYCEGSKISRQEPEELSNNCFSERLENQSPRHLSGCNTYEIMNSMSCKAKNCIGDNHGDTNICELCHSAWNVHGITPCNDFKSNNLTSQCDVVPKTNSHFPIQVGRGNSCLVQQKNQNNAKGNWKRISNFCYVERDVCLLEKNLWVKHNSFPSRGLLPSPLISPPGYKKSAHGIKTMVNKESLMHTNMPPLVESPQWASQQKLNRVFYKHLSQLSQPSTMEIDCGKSKSYNSFNHENNYSRKEELGSYDGNFFRLHDKSGLFQKESSQVRYEVCQYKNDNSAQRASYNSQYTAGYGTYCLNSSPAFSPLIRQNAPPSTNLIIPGQCELNELQPHNCMKAPRMEDMSSRSFRAPIDSKMCPNLKFHNGPKHSTGVKKWIPVGTKTSKLPKQTISAGESCIAENSSAKVDGPEVVTVSAQDHQKNGKKPNFNPKFFIGSHISAEALKAAYQMQLESEVIHFVMGYPLAEFERLVHSAAPVITSSCVSEKCVICKDNQLSHCFLCKHQIPNVSLRAVWNWYEKPGNYGLEVKAEDSRNLNGFDIDSMSFHAHFVPFLSAVQLFGFSHPPKHSVKNREHANLEMQDKGELESHSSFPATSFVRQYPEDFEVQCNVEDDIEPVANCDSIEEPVSSSKFSLCNESDSLSLDCLPTFFDTELVFEFFESEQPQNRKPLYDKIVELIDSGSSNNQIYGDPSKLELMKLHELHPASWFSVAWYPIYRIPEGNFRASFLTFHSLGHLVHKLLWSDFLNEDIFCIVSPVLGLQSYNAQGECWFNQKIPVETSLKESTPFNGSEILKERLKKLEENAQLFSRGCVYKNNVMAFNRQPDYEFFLSRKS
ncbi:hypothetical protein I3843_03G162000 [Carya illinoinensis]|uniref:Uncharacterized protein n=1 Tax=Carya illinoinensis TaxID=32201 RepID=A0A922FLQ0_CARIL|nr:hypothetical protein I3842_03G159700 [Carya illinoinensis]KAG6722440.1 hypothetical protein I3842_03G159700 [Carya illinoinensis]KAG6722441.1 hypothetical protein I3842_03G159700 [Carya illinoinensis]KAG7987974.1 hypothetical protein I3843_03G162000 [Carya illinoinensis]KAG7987979.1 hypothetical protein I3843_03G162000 [Carya illinoinensis]